MSKRLVTGLSPIAHLLSCPCDFLDAPIASSVRLTGKVLPMCEKVPKRTAGLLDIQGAA